MQVERNQYIEQLDKLQSNGLVKVITGIRRCGKSYLLDPLFKNHLQKRGVPSDHIIKIDLDQDDNAKFLDKTYLDRYLKGKIVDNHTYYILLDEIQLVDGFEKVLSGLIKLPNVEVYVTGSNSRFLSSDIITEFRGRGTEIRVYPFSFAEFMSFYPGDKIDGWVDYFTFGGLPLVALEPAPELKMKYLKELTANVYLNDVTERNHIKNDSDLKVLTEILSSSIGSLTSSSKLSNTYRSLQHSSLDDKTITQYLKYLREAFLLDEAKRYDLKGKKYINSPVKYYFTDVGTRNSIISFRQTEENHIMENIIFLELKRRGYEVDVGVVEKRENNLRKQLEVDFVASKGNDKLYVQSALSVAEPEKLAQEIRPLVTVSDSFKKIIITGQNSAHYRDENGIEIMSVFDFLLQ